MLLEQLRRSWYDSSPAYARVAITRENKNALRWKSLTPMLPQWFTPLSSPLSLPLPLPIKAAFKVGLDMVHQFVFTHQGRGKGRTVASSSPMQVLLEHPSTRKRKLTKLNDKDHGKVRSGGAI
jgi:hypothetical protein